MTSIYREALQASAVKISALTDVALNDLVRDLLRAQAYLAGSEPGVMNTEVKAKDEGCDGWSSAPQSPDRWLGSSNTCWQLKAGVAGQPNRLKGEIIKAIPSKTLREGGRVVVVCSGSTDGLKGVKARRDVLVEEAERAGLPSDQIEVMDSARLTNWCNEHPAIAASQAGRPGGLWRLQEWANSDEHKVSWQPTKLQRDAIEGLHKELDLASGELLHFHVTGHPGVGKTRFALELCKEAAWAPFVIYIQQAADLRLAELVASCVSDRGGRVVVVVDEVQLEQLPHVPG